MQEKERTADFVMLCDLGPLLETSFRGRTADWGQVDLFASQLGPDSPALKIREEGVRNAEFDRTAVPAYAACRHQQQSKNASDDEAVRASDAIARQSVQEDYEKAASEETQPPPPLPPQ